MARTHTILPPVAHLILQQGQKILLIHRPKDQRFNGAYDLPADFSGNAEASTAAAIRAGKEELDIDIDPSDLEFAVLTHGLYPDGSEHYDFYFRALRWRGEPRITSLHRGTESGWADLAKLPANLTPATQLGLEVARGGIPYVEYGFEASNPAAFGHAPDHKWVG